MKKTGKTTKTFDVTIEKLVYGGMGFARHQGKVVFVPFSAPGDRIRVQVIEEKKTFIRANMVRILKSGNDRIAPVCSHFGICGGCHWQHVAYSSQVEAKRQILEELFHHRFPATQDLEIAMRACEQPFNYRSRARVQMRGCGAGATVGFYRHRSHAVEDIEECPLLRPSLNEALFSLKQFRLKIDRDAASQEMDMACAEEEGSWATAPISPETSEGITTLLGTRKGEDVILRRQVGDFSYAVTASVFFQANDFMVSELAALVRDLAQERSSGSALDLFSGVGLFSLPLARHFKKVVAVENTPASTRLCVSNARAARLDNIQVVCADAASWIDAAESSGSSPFDLVVLDPPRIGAGAAVMDRIWQWAPSTIIYVSCDPQTLCRDIAELSHQNYRIDHIQGLDMFPQTFHFETVVRLIRD